MSDKKTTDSAPVPADKNVRDAIRGDAVGYVQRAGLVPPIEIVALREHAKSLLARGGYAAEF